ncbi:proteasomal ATPase-associated factor 1-like [Neodiprion fabricii]|uniref:proteasomal ATPase-associated factor 1-like n=1 Tax=Neodiprion fabricii TaxID=2872261 RepID=UPI001ED94196|nr:proteasomal ATPase-associated factor 1-like [Neodiprion fabricii]
MTANGNLPVINIRCDWDACLRGRDKEAWISYKYRDQLSVTGKLELRDGQISCSEGFTLMSYTGKSVTIKHTDSGTVTTFVAPLTSFPLHTKSCTRVSVTPGGLGLSSGSQGELQIWEVQRGVIRRTLEGHVGEIYQCRWFPSGVVVLGGGADWRTRVWCAQTGKCPVTLVGHTAPVTDMVIVERGRNVITASKDGSARLWDVGESKCLAVLCELTSSIIACAITSSNQLELPPNEEVLSDREIGTPGKVLALGCEDGTLALVAIAARAELGRKILPSSVSALSLVSNECLAVGLENGQIYLISIVRQLETLRVIHESNSPVRALLVYRDLLLVGQTDGVCIGYRLSSSNKDPISPVRLQLTGSDFEPINDLTSDGQDHIYVGARDGCIRKYQVGDIVERL